MLKIWSMEHYVDRLMCFAWAHFFSIGFKSGEYGGKYNTVWPHSSKIFCMSLPLWKVALSMTITLSWGNSGSKNSFTHDVKTLVWTEPDIKPIAIKVLSIKAPIDLFWGSAFGWRRLFFIGHCKAFFCMLYTRCTHSKPVRPFITVCIRVILYLFLSSCVHS